MAHRLRLWLLLYALACFAQAQEIRLDLGFNGQVVANRWNPIVLELRGHPAITLRLQIDQGNLKDGEIPITYLAKLPPSQGFSHFEDQLYLPEWRNISWVIESSERILASGSLGRRQADPKRLTLVLSNNLASWIDLLPNQRVTEALSHQLPENLAAYDGVETLIMDGTVTAPSPEAIVSAVTSGTRVIFFEPLPSSYASLKRLVEQNSRLGVGFILSVDRTTFNLNRLEENSMDMANLVTKLEDDTLKDYPTLANISPVLILASLFCLAILLMFRFLPNTAVSTSIVLSLIACILAWTWLKPFPSVIEQTRTLIVSGGDLAFQQSLLAIVNLPAESRRIPFASRLNKSLSHSQGPDFTELSLNRWSNLVLYKKPQLTQASFSLLPSEKGLELRNSTSFNLSRVYVIGKGWQDELAADSQILVKDGPLSPLPTRLERLSASLPTGTALAETANLILVALPEVKP